MDQRHYDRKFSPETTRSASVADGDDMLRKLIADLNNDAPSTNPTESSSKIDGDSANSTTTVSSSPVASKFVDPYSTEAGAKWAAAMIQLRKGSPPPTKSWRSNLAMSFVAAVQENKRKRKRAEAMRIKKRKLLEKPSIFVTSESEKDSTSESVNEPETEDGKLAALLDDRQPPITQPKFSSEEMKQFCRPLEHGWKREFVFRKTQTKGNIADVYYVTPNGLRLRSLREIDDYLRTAPDEFTRDNFTFRRVILGFNKAGAETVRGSLNQNLTESHQETTARNATSESAHETVTSSKARSTIRSKSTKHREIDRPTKSEENDDSSLSRISESVDRVMSNVLCHGFNSSTTKQLSKAADKRLESGRKSACRFSTLGSKKQKTSDSETMNERTHGGLDKSDDEVENGRVAKHSGELQSRDTRKRSSPEIDVGSSTTDRFHTFTCRLCKQLRRAKFALPKGKKTSSAALQCDECAQKSSEAASKTDAEFLTSWRSDSDAHGMGSDQEADVSNAGVVVGNIWKRKHVNKTITDTATTGSTTVSSLNNYEKCLECVFRYLTVRDLLKIRLVCKSWNVICCSSSVWRLARMNNCQIANIDSWNCAVNFLRERGVQAIDANGCDAISGSSVMFLDKILPQLTFICSWMFGKNSPTLMDKCCQYNSKNLTSIELTATNERDSTDVIPGKYFEKLCECKQLVELRLDAADDTGKVSRAFIGGDQLSFLNTLCNLTILVLLDVRFTRANDLNFLSSLSKLRDLEIGDCGNFAYEICAKVGLLTSLRRLRLETFMLTSPDEKFTDQFSNLVSLREVTLTNYSIDVPSRNRAVVQFLSSLLVIQNLHTLRLLPSLNSKTAMSVWRQTLESLENFNSLRRLELGFIADYDNSATPRSRRFQAKHTPFVTVAQRNKNICINTEDLTDWLKATLPTTSINVTQAFLASQQISSTRSTRWCW